MSDFKQQNFKSGFVAQLPKIAVAAALLMPAGSFAQDRPKDSPAVGSVSNSAQLTAEALAKSADAVKAAAEALRAQTTNCRPCTPPPKCPPVRRRVAAKPVPHVVAQQAPVKETVILQAPTQVHTVDMSGGSSTGDNYVFLGGGGFGGGSRSVASAAASATVVNQYTVEPTQQAPAKPAPAPSQPALSLKLNIDVAAPTSVVAPTHVQNLTVANLPTNIDNIVTASTGPISAKTGPIDLSTGAVGVNAPTRTNNTVSFNQAIDVTANPNTRTGRIDSSVKIAPVMPTTTITNRTTLLLGHKR